MLSYYLAVELIEFNEVGPLEYEASEKLGTLEIRRVREDRDNLEAPTLHFGAAETILFDGDNEY